MDDERVEATREGIVVSSLDDGRITFEASDDTKSDIRDPVCGTRLTSAAEPSAAHDGKTYYFCSEACRRDFLKDPERYLRKP